MIEADEGTAEREKCLMDGGSPSIADRQVPGAVEPDQGSLDQPTVVPEVDTSLPGARLTRVLDRFVAERGRPKQIVLDNGRLRDERLSHHWFLDVADA